MSVCRLLRVTLAVVLGLSLNATLLRADDVVTACDQQSLEAAIANGGLITLECDGTILLTNTISIADDITLDATGHNVTIASPGGTNGVRVFQVEEFWTLTLLNLKLADGVSTNGGAVFVATDASLTAMNCSFSNNLAQAADGLIGIGSSTNSNGKTGGDGRNGKSGGAAAGGAVYSLGFASFTECVFLTNSAVGGFGGDGGHGGRGQFSGGDGGDAGRGGAAWGGAIFNGGEMTINACSFQDNKALGGFGGLGGRPGLGIFPGFTGRGGSGGPASGAALFNSKTGIVDVAGSTFALNGTSSGDSGDAENGNSTGKKGPAGPESSGGAIANYGLNTLVNCTFFANAAIGGSAGKGGDTPFQGGKGGQGGGAWGGNVFNGGKTAEMYATNCTFSDGGAIGGTNGLGGQAPFPGKHGKLGFSRGSNLANSNGLFFLKNCILAYPNPGTNAYGKFRDVGYNLSSDRSIQFVRNSGSRTNVDPLLDVLRNNGGPVQTIELLSGSPAIDGGDTNFCLGTDARGVGRPAGGRCDIGSYEAGQRLVAPVITTQPANQSVQEGGTITFRVVATGDPPLFYQWYGGSTNFAGDLIDDATNSTYTIDIADSSDEGGYYVVVSNNSGSTTSENATLTVLIPPSILEGPESMSVPAGGTFTLTVNADGDEPLRYRWFTNGVPIPGAILDHYSVVDAQFKDSGDYYVEVCNDVACVLSDLATVTVTFTPPTILVQPATQFVAVGRPVTFAVQVSGSPTFDYFWRKDSVIVFSQLGVTSPSSSLVIANAQTFTNGLYDVIVSNIAGSVTSAVATLTVQTTGPSIVTQPVGTTISECNSYSLDASAAGSTPLAYQWYVNGAAVPGATAASLVFTNILGANEGTYFLVVTNAVGSVTSAPAVVNVQRIAPLITQQPVDVSGFTGQTIAFNPAVCGSMLAYQWFFNATNAIVGATNAALVIPNGAVSNNGTYHFQVTNPQGAATSATVSVTLTSSPPLITEHPAILSSLAGTNMQVTLRFGVVGSQPMFFQWYFNDVPLSNPVSTTISVTNPASGSLLRLTNGVAGSSLTVMGIRPADEGNYVCVATNSLGAATSNDGGIDVLP